MFFFLVDLHKNIIFSLGTSRSRLSFAELLVWVQCTQTKTLHESSTIFFEHALHFARIRFRTQAFMPSLTQTELVVQKFGPQPLKKLQ